MPLHKSLPSLQSSPSVQSLQINSPKVYTRSWFTRMRKLPSDVQPIHHLTSVYLMYPHLPVTVCKKLFHSISVHFTLKRGWGVMINYTSLNNIKYIFLIKGLRIFNDYTALGDIHSIQSFPNEFHQRYLFVLPLGTSILG